MQRRWTAITVLAAVSSTVARFLLIWGTRCAGSDHECQVPKSGKGYLYLGSYQRWIVNPKGPDLVFAEWGVQVKRSSGEPRDMQSATSEDAQDTWDGRSPAPDWLDATRILGDPYATRILMAAADREVPASALVRTLGIPPAACYRRLRSLLRAGLVSSREGPVARNGRAKLLFQSRVESVRVVFDEGRLHAQIRLRPDGSREAGEPSDPI